MMRLFLLISIFTFSSSCFAKLVPSSMEEILDCSISVVHGKVVTGEISEGEIEFLGRTLEESYGEYEVKILENIVGEEFKELVKVNIEFSALQGGGGGYTYPAPGLEYIFVIWKSDEGLEVSPYHLPIVNYIQGKKYVTNDQNAFLEGVTYLFYDEKFNLKEGKLKSKWNNEGIHPHVDSKLGYIYSSYINNIISTHGKCESE